MIRWIAASFLFLLLLSCTPPDAGENRIVIWHQMRPDEQSILHRQLDRYMKAHMCLTPVASTAFHMA